MSEVNDPDDPLLVEAKTNFERMRSRLNAARIAYARNLPFDGRKVTYDDLRRIAEETIQANYELQRRRYGTVKLKLSASKLLRRGW